MCVQDVLNDLQWWGLVFRDKLSEDLRTQGKKTEEGEMVELIRTKKASALRAI